MNFVSWEISLIALVPAVVLCIYIYIKDKIEREPIGFLAILFGLGAVSYFPTYFIERGILDWMDNLFGKGVSFSAEGMISYSSPIIMFFHMFLNAFIGRALIEVGMKWVILFFSTRNNKNFNYLFDGIVYSAFISLGYAVAENIKFAWTNGWNMIVLRSLSAIPCHLITGIMMGYFYALWNAHRKARQLEMDYFERGIIEDVRIHKPVSILVMSGILPFIVTGIYLFAGTIDSKSVNALLYFVIFLMYGISFVGVERIASNDKSSLSFSKKVVHEKHPEVDRSAWISIDEKLIEKRETYEE